MLAIRNCLLIFFRENVLELIVYFQDVSYQFLEQQPAYDKASAFGEFLTLSVPRLGSCVVFFFQHGPVTAAKSNDTLRACF